MKSVGTEDAEDEPIWTSSMLLASKADSADTEGTAEGVMVAGCEAGMELEGVTYGEAPGELVGRLVAGPVMDGVMAAVGVMVGEENEKSIGAKFTPL
jgi:hypothetical protein